LSQKVKNAVWKNAIWLAFDAGAGFGSTAIQINPNSRAFLAFLAFQVDLVICISEDEITEVRQYKDCQ
jgi:hypothetical protein